MSLKYIANYLEKEGFKCKAERKSKNISSLEFYVDKDNFFNLIDIDLPPDELEEINVGEPIGIYLVYFHKDKNRIALYIPDFFVTENTFEKKKALNLIVKTDIFGIKFTIKKERKNKYNIGACKELLLPSNKLITKVFKRATFELIGACLYFIERLEETE